jgi:hypothetical protein
MPEISLISGINPICGEFYFDGFTLSLRPELRLKWLDKGLQLAGLAGSTEGGIVYGDYV